MNHTVRQATQADFSAIEALVMAAYAKYIARIGRKPRPMLADYRTALAKHPFWVCELAGVVVAVLELIPGGDHLLIENIAVDPAYQRLGIGRSLLQFAEAEARRQGYSEVRLYTNERFTENLGWYARQGYRETHREPMLDSAIVHMSKSVRI